jgi:flagellar motor protein MotB
LAEKKGITIIIKRKKASHAGAHGGAWKVAYADFVTAMMAFFLVMWLLGSDEEIRAAVSQYFNNPSSVWQPDLTSKEMVPLGDRTGAGETILKGAEGAVPEDMAEKPARPYQLHSQQGEDDGDVIEPLVAGRDFFDLQILRFTIPMRSLFKAGNEKPDAQAFKALERIAKITKAYKGSLTISTDPVLVKLSNGKDVDPYEFALTRSVNLRKFFVENKWMNESQLGAKVRDHSQAVAGGEEEASRRTASVVEFTLTARKPASEK